MQNVAFGNRRWLVSKIIPRNRCLISHNLLAIVMTVISVIPEITTQIFLRRPATTEVQQVDDPRTELD
jgi:sensor domain CHASE-containing protein